MRLLITVGYTDVLFAKGAEVSRLLEAFNGAKVVTKEGPYNAPKYVPVGNETTFRLELIDEDSVSLPESSNELMDKVLALDRERIALSEKVRELQKKLEGVGAAISKDPKGEA